MEWRPNPHVWNAGLSQKDLWTLQYALDKYNLEADMEDPFTRKQEVDPTVAEVVAACGSLCHVTCVLYLIIGFGMAAAENA